MHFQRLRDLREDNDLKQSEIAQLLQMSQQQYSLYETGKRELPMSMFIILAKFYKVSLDYIAGLTNDKRGIGHSDKSSITFDQKNNRGKIVNKIKK